MFLVQLLRLKRDVLLSRRPLFPVLSHPRFPAPAGCGVASTESQGGDLRILNRDLLVRIFGKEPDRGIGKRFSGAAVEDVALNFAAVLAGDGNVAAVIEGLLQSLTQLFFDGQIRNPALQLLVSKSGNHLEKVGIFAEMRLAAGLLFVP